jgi:hypothetical protein
MSVELQQQQKLLLVVTSVQKVEYLEKPVVKHFGVTISGVRIEFIGQVVVDTILPLMVQ